MLIERNRKGDRGTLDHFSRRGDGHRAQSNSCLLGPCLDVERLYRHRLGCARGGVADGHCGGVDVVRGVATTERNKMRWDSVGQKSPVIVTDSLHGEDKTDEAGIGGGDRDVSPSPAMGSRQVMIRVISVANKRETWGSPRIVKAELRQAGVIYFADCFL